MYRFDKKNVLYFSIAVLVLQGCNTSHELSPKPISQKAVNEVSETLKTSGAKNVWNKKPLPLGKIDKECIDCYAKPITETNVPLEIETPIVKEVSPTNRTYYAKVNTNLNKSIGGYDFIETDADRSVQSDLMVNTQQTKAKHSMISAYDSYAEDYSSHGLAIQVGAFRAYSGAKTIRKQYDKLSKKYKIAIKTGTKGNKPIHRVRIEGFKSSGEAKKFMNRYGLKDAFLVRK